MNKKILEEFDDFIFEGKRDCDCDNRNKHKCKFSTGQKNGCNCFCHNVFKRNEGIRIFIKKLLAKKDQELIEKIEKLDMGSLNISRPKPENQLVKLEEVKGIIIDIIKNQ